MKKAFLAAACSALLTISQSSLATPLLNVSYDVMRDFYRDYNPAFQKYWQQQGHKQVQIRMSHGGSSKQARSVIDGLQADVITMNMATDINALHDYGQLIPQDWASRLPDNSAPFSSATVFIVRKGNPKNIHDWGDLVKPGMEVIIPNPKTSGNGRYTYLSAWAYVLKQGGDEQQVREFLQQLFTNVPVMNTGGRGATSTFMQNHIGDALITFENEAEMIAREFGRGEFSVVYPSVSAKAEPPVTIVDRVVERKGTREVAQAYLDYLWSEEGQRIAAMNYLRPNNKEILAEFADRFPAVELMPVEETFGNWREIQRIHFDDGGAFDQIYRN